MTSPYEDGNPNAKICILGEAPSRVEIIQGKPLVGPSGQLLEQCLHAAGLVRNECYILNLFPFEVNKSKDTNSIRDDRGDILWTYKGGLTDEGEKASKEIFDKLRNCKANVIVGLGGTVSSVLMGDARITKIRGSQYPCYRLEGRKVLPTIHPAASLRGQYIYRYFIISDLAKAKVEKEYPELRIPQREMLVSPSLNDVFDFLHEVEESGETAFDIEITNHQIYCLGYSASPTKIMSIPFVDDTGLPWWSEDDEVKVWTRIAEIQGNPEIRKIAQNAIFDISVMFQRNHVHTAMPYEDIMIAHHICWPDFPKGLDFQASIHTNEPYYKDEGKQWNKIEEPVKFREYNAKDCGVTHEIWHAIQGELDNGYRQTYEETMAMFPIFLTMMMRGVRVDRQRLDEAKIAIEAEIDAKTRELEDVAEYPFNPKSPKQCLEYFYVVKGITPYISRTTGKPTTDDKAMSRIFRRHRLREAKLVQEIRGLSKLLGTYFEVGIDGDDRLRCTYNLRGTVTGRPSSSQTIFGSGMNMQNLDPRFKHFLVADR